MFDYTWLTDLLIEFGRQYPAYFESCFADNLQALLPPFWFLILFGLLYYPYERRQEK